MVGVRERSEGTYTFFRYGPGDGRALHLALWVDDDACVVLQGKRWSE